MNLTKTEYEIKVGSSDSTEYSYENSSAILQNFQNMEFTTSVSLIFYHTIPTFNDPV